MDIPSVAITVSCKVTVKPKVHASTIPDIRTLHEKSHSGFARVPFRLVQDVFRTNICCKKTIENVC